MVCLSAPVAQQGSNDLINRRTWGQHPPGAPVFIRRDNLTDIEELWKPVIGYEGLYEVSNIGKVRSVERDIIDKNGVKRHITQKLLKTQTWTYHYVVLKKDGKQKMFDIHRLVALAWVHNPDPENFNIVNHKDENIHNNCYLNLEWCDTKYNNSYGTLPKRMSEKLKGRIPPNAVSLIELNSGKSFNSIKEAINELHISERKIKDMLSGTIDSYKGFRLRRL